MYKEDKFVEELDALLKKHEIERFTGIIHLEGRARVLCHAPTTEEERENANEYSRLMRYIGSYETESVKKLSDFLEHCLQKLDEDEETISQVSWEKIANKNAEDILSIEDYENLIETKELKNAYCKAYKWEEAAKMREKELELLKTVIKKMEEDGKDIH